MSNWDTHVVYMSYHFSVGTVLKSFSIYFQDFVRHLQVCLVSRGACMEVIRSFLIKKNTDLPTVKFDAFVIGLNQDNDVASKIDHFSILVLHVFTYLNIFLVCSPHWKYFCFSAAFWFLCHYVTMSCTKHKIFLWKYLNVKDM